MKRLRELTRKERSLRALSDAVSAMKSLSAHHLRQARRSLANAREYREIADDVLSATDLSGYERDPEPTRILLVSSDLGLCGSYNSQLARAALREAGERQVEGVYCVGRRAANALRKEGLTIYRIHPAPSSVDGLSSPLLELAQALLEDYIAGKYGSLRAVSARFEGVGSFRPVAYQILPVPSNDRSGKIALSSYVSPRRLATVALREYLYITLYEILLDALAAEHGARLVATESAAEWLEDRLESTHRDVAAVQRELGTQEVLEIASGARSRRRRHKPQTSPHATA